STGSSVEFKQLRAFCGFGCAGGEHLYRVAQWHAQRLDWNLLCCPARGWVVRAVSRAEARSQPTTGITTPNLGSRRSSRRSHRCFRLRQLLWLGTLKRLQQRATGTDALRYLATRTKSSS